MSTTTTGNDPIATAEAALDGARTAVGAERARLLDDARRAIESARRALFFADTRCTAMALAGEARR